MKHSYLYVRAMLRSNPNGNKLYYSVYPNIPGNMATVLTYVERNNARNDVYIYEFIPNSCIKKMFGSDTWSDQKSL